jgi:hypothetical protein
MARDYATEILTYVDGQVGERIVDAPPLQMKPGENLWVLARSNDDLAEVSRVEREAVALLRATWSAVSSPWPWEPLVSTGPSEWRLGLARPVRLEVSAVREPVLPAGQELAARVRFPDDGLPSLTAPPVWVLCRIWWRGGPVAVPWPLVYPPGGLGKARTISGGLRWMLASALIPTAPDADPGDETWAAAQAQSAKDAVLEPVADAAHSAADTASSIARTVALWTAVGLAGVGALWAAWRLSRKRSR